MNKQLPPVKIIQNDRIKNFCTKLAEGLEKASGFITGQKVLFTPFEPFLMPLETFSSIYSKKSVVMKIHSSQAFEGIGYFLFEFKTAVAMGAFIRLQTESAIQEKINQENFEPADYDSFGEVGNQLCGILDREFRQLTVKKIHLRLDFDKTIFPATPVPEFLIPDTKEFVVLLSTIQVPKSGSQKVTIMLPRALVEALLSIEIELEGVTPKIAVIYSENKDFCIDQQKKINTRHAKVIVAESAEDALLLAKKPNVACVAIELAKMAIPFGHNESIFLKRFATNNLIMKKIPCFFTMKDATQAEIDKLKEIGIIHAKLGSIENEFQSWCQAYLR